MSIEFNHLVVTLDSKSIESINKSDFLIKEFCNFKRQSVESGDESWTGTYLFGKLSYMELFAPEGAEGLAEGFSGIGFNTVQIGQIDDVEDRLKKLMPGKTKRGLRMRKISDGEIPWFHFLAIEGSGGGRFSPWLMEFHVDYLESRDVQLPESGLFDRGSLLNSDNRKNSYTSLFDDISEVRLELIPQEHERLKVLLKAFGYGSSKNGGITVYRTKGFVLKVTEAKKTTYCIKEAICSLTSKYETINEICFGNNAKLSLTEGCAHWVFGPIGESGKEGN